MDNLKIGTFNTKDNKTNSHGGLREDGVSNAEIVSNIINKENFDLLGTQELTINYTNEIAMRTGSYKFYGSYRYGNLLKNLPYNENNNIVTKRNVLYNKTIWLPWVANNFKDLKTSIVKMSIMPRIATVVISEDEEHRKICMINTHLDYQVESIQKRQLEALKNLITKYSSEYKVVLTGDFNIEKNQSHFQTFVRDVKDEIKLVDIEGTTWHGKNGEQKQEDYIFVPKDWSIEDAGIINSENTSDHDIVYASVRQK